MLNKYKQIIYGLVKRFNEHEITNDRQRNESGKSMIKAWNKITVERLTAIVDIFPKLFNVCIAANGGYFEKALC